MASDAEVSELWVYPLKGARGQSLSVASICSEGWGLRWDRRWMIVAEREGGTAWAFVSQRQKPQLAAIVATVDEAPSAGARPSLLLSCDWVPRNGAYPTPPPIAVPLQLASDAGAQIRTGVRIWKDTVTAVDQGDAVAAWLRSALGGDDELRLVFADAATTVRPCDARFISGASTAFSDGFPVLVTSEASLAALNSAIAAGSQSSEGPLPMTRFRPNIVVRGAGLRAWEEDTWLRFSFDDDVNAAGVKRCSRCLVTTTDQKTGVQGNRHSEPLHTLTGLRSDIEGKQAYFGMNTVLRPREHRGSGDQGGDTLRVGSALRVIERGPIPPL